MSVRLPQTQQQRSEPLIILPPRRLRQGSKAYSQAHAHGVFRFRNAHNRRLIQCLIGQPGTMPCGWLLHESASGEVKAVLQSPRRCYYV